MPRYILTVNDQEGGDTSHIDRFMESTKDFLNSNKWSADLRKDDEE